MRKIGDLQDFKPIKEITSGITLKWTTTANSKKTHDKCLSWTRHEQTCSRHASNFYKFVRALALDEEDEKDSYSTIKELPAKGM